jgi:uncharacterized cofD-like protein
MKPPSTAPQIVVIGGGTGTSVLLTGLKTYPVHLSAIISMADSGGSTGRLRDEFGFLPVGDLRQALAALSSDTNHAAIAKLLLYRFNKGSGLAGHNLGNLILTALQDMTGSTDQAIDIAHHIFRLHGTIIPVTLENIQLQITYEGGSKEIGEHILDEQHGGEKIVSVNTVPPAHLNPKAKKALEKADIIVIGPGDLYGSIMPNLIVSGFKSAIKNTKATIIYVVNLMTHYTQTHNLSARDHLNQIEMALGRSVDKVLINNAPISKAIRNQYAAQHEFPVKDDLKKTASQLIIRSDLISAVPVVKTESDSVHRSYLRHNPAKIARIVINTINSKEN